MSAAALSFILGLIQEAISVAPTFVNDIKQLIADFEGQAPANQPPLDIAGQTQAGENELHQTLPKANA